MHLIIQYQNELLKGIRNIDKPTEEMMEQFVIFLSTHTFGSAQQAKMLNTLNVVSVFDPEANWSKRWTRNLAIRKTFISILAKSPSLLQHIIECVNKGLKEPPLHISVSISDQPTEVRISGDTVKTLTYFHCLAFLSQLCSYKAGRTLLSEIPLETPFDMSNFIITLINSLNELVISEGINEVYNATCRALQKILEHSTILSDTDFYKIALRPLYNNKEVDITLWPHVLCIMKYMLDTVDGSMFIISDLKKPFGNVEKSLIKCPAAIILQHISNLLKQPFSIMNVKYIFDLSEVVKKLFYIFDTYDVVRRIVQDQFYPAVSSFYKKLDKYFVENENKAQHLISIIKSLMLQIISIPFGLQDLSQVPLVFEELIRGFIAPLRNSWTSTDVVNFVSSTAFFNLGCEVLKDLAPHVLSTLLSDTCKIVEDPQQFHDPWEDQVIQKFLHILALFSLNFKCFHAFMVNVNTSESSAENIPRNLYELMECAVNFESTYHHLGLLSLQIVLWNLDIYIYLIELLNFQNVLLMFQSYSSLNVEIEDEMRTEYIIDECSLLRHKILCNSYYIKHKYNDKIPLEEFEDSTDFDEYQLFSTLPPPNIVEKTVLSTETDWSSDLETMLQGSKPALLDSSWISQMRIAHRESRGIMKNAVLINLLDQMWQATPTAEWADNFEWENNITSNIDFCLPEEIHGIDLMLQYAQRNEIMQSSEEAKKTFKKFIQASYVFIKYQKPNAFKGFDWFLATIFIICEGDINKCKMFITKFIRFPSIMFIWPTLGRAIDENNNEECTTQLMFSQLLETIINNEMPNIVYALKNSCGTNWWMLCTTMLNQCFWGILPWHEIMHFLSISILYSPDYILYYCISLIYHCQKTFMQDITNGKKWPENMVFNNYHCHDYIAFMDNLAKRYGNRILPAILNSSNEA